MGSEVKEFESVNAIANCIEVTAAEVTAPRTIYDIYDAKTGA